MRKVTTLVAGFLLMTGLTLNAHAFTMQDEAGIRTQQTQEVGWCYVYIMGRWWYLPC